MKSIFNLSILSVLLLVCSCNPGQEYTPKIKELDSLQIELDKDLAVFKSVDTIKLRRCLTTYSNNVKWMEDNIKDTLTADYLNTFKKYKGIDEPITFLVQNYKGLISDVNLSKDQLSKLSLDMKNKVLEEERAFEYYTIEKNEAVQMISALKVNHQLAKESMDTFEKYNNEVEKLITIYKNAPDKK